MNPREIVREFLSYSKLGNGFTVNHDAISEMVDTYFEVFGEVADRDELAKITPEGVVALAVWGYYYSKTGEDIRKMVPMKELMKIISEEVPKPILDEIRRRIDARR